MGLAGAAVGLAGRMEVAQAESRMLMIQQEPEEAQATVARLGVLRLLAELLVDLAAHPSMGSQAAPQAQTRLLDFQGSRALAVEAGGTST